jgi:succinate dehydrogenase / fumarate reductase cytochrome b subunit
MGSLGDTLRSSIGAKVIMALTGLIMIGFLFGHLGGNLLIFLGPEAINGYTEGLHKMPLVVWGTRIVLAVSVIFHINTAVRLTRANQAAKPTKYAVAHHVAATLPSRTMFPTGLVLLLYIAYHLAHYTFRVTNPEFRLLPANDTYSMVVMAFQNSIVAGAYVVAMIALGFHLNHGGQSAFQTLGINHKKYNFLIKRAFPMLCGLLAIGFISIPVAVTLGIIK